jgi:hypothetical protein|tara:strand:+ start:4138 stop:4335 length:198 start_codon:yes stop_codon:yes gene_type:complete
VTETLGGNGAISIFLEKITSRIILQNDIHYRQAILNILTKNNLAFYLRQENSDFVVNILAVMQIS